MSVLFFFFTAPATTEIYTLSLHDALPIFFRRPTLPSRQRRGPRRWRLRSVKSCRWPLAQCVRQLEQRHVQRQQQRSEEHTSELQSQSNLVCRLLLEKKKKKKTKQ